LILENTKKGDDDVFMCTMNSSRGIVQRYFNNGKQTQIQLDPYNGLSNIKVTSNDGVLNCQFIISKEGSFSTYYSLYNHYYVLLAKGHLSATSM
jgi:hypothetical protein